MTHSATLSLTLPSPVPLRTSIYFTKSAASCQAQYQYATTDMCQSHFLTYESRARQKSEPPSHGVSKKKKWFHVPLPPLVTKSPLLFSDESGAPTVTTLQNPGRVGQWQRVCETVWLGLTLWLNNCGLKQSLKIYKEWLCAQLAASFIR